MTGDITNAVREYYAHRPDADAVYLFGSVARDTATASSDVDLAVLYDKPQPPALDSTPHDDAVKLSLALGREVDLIALNTCSVDLAHRVIATGHVLVENNRPRRIAFEVAARNRYFDLKPILDQYRRREPR